MFRRLGSIAFCILLVPGCAGILGPQESRIPEANAVRFTPDGSRIVSGYLVTVIKEDSEGEQDVSTRPIINIHDSGTGRILRQIKRGDGIWDLDLSPNGRTIAAADEDKRIRLYDIDGGNLLREMTGHLDRVFCLAYSPDGGLLASGGGDGRILLWNPLTGALVRTLDAHGDTVYGVEFSPDGRTLVSSGSSDGLVRFWDALNGSLLRTFDTGKSFVTDVDFSPTGRTLAIGGGRSVLLLDLLTGVQTTELGPHSGQVNATAFSPDGARIAAGAAGLRQLVLWDPVTSDDVREFDGLRAQALSITWSPDGTRFATGSSDGTVRLWNPDSGQQLWSSRP